MQRVTISPQPVGNFARAESNRTALSLVRYHAIVNDIQSIKQAAVGQVQLVGYAVRDHRHVRWKWERSQCGRGAETVFYCTMLVNDVVVWISPAVGRVSFFDVDDDEVCQVGVVGSHSTDVVEVSHERRSSTAAEDDDQRPRCSLEVQQTSRLSAVQTDNITVERRTSHPHRLSLVNNVTA